MSYLGTPDFLFLNSRRSGLKKNRGGLYLTTPFKKTGGPVLKKGGGRCTAIQGVAYQACYSKSVSLRVSYETCRCKSVLVRMSH